MTTRELHITRASLDMTSKRLKKLKNKHREITNQSNYLVEELTPVSHIRPLFVRFLYMMKSLIVYQGVLETELLIIQDDLNNLKQKLEQS